MGRQGSVLGRLDEPDALGIETGQCPQTALRDRRIARLVRVAEARIAGSRVARRKRGATPLDDAARGRRQVARADDERIGMPDACERPMQPGRRLEPAR